MRSLADRETNGGERRVISSVFKGVQNRMLSGYPLRDVINKINHDLRRQ
ncbi:hypothetical protein [Lysobacter sp. Root690]|nr:hypothetical protein [Lysobacter sp. Root690]